MADLQERSRRREQALDLLNKGCFAEAEPALLAAVEQTRCQNNTETWNWMRCAAMSLAGQRKFSEAEPFAWNAFNGFRMKWGPQDEDALDCQYLLGAIRYGRKMFQEAKRFVEAALDGMEQNSKRGPEHLSTLRCKALSALLLSAEGEHIHAQNVAQSALTSLETVIEKSEVSSSQGCRRPTPIEELTTLEIQDMLAEVLDGPMGGKDKKRFSSKDTVSTHAPNDEGLDSRFPSKV